MTMNFYLSLVDAQLKSEKDNASIGLILCRNRNKLVAEYALRDLKRVRNAVNRRSSPFIDQYTENVEKKECK